MFVCRKSQEMSFQEILSPQMAQSEYKTTKIRLEWAITKNLIESVYTEKGKEIKSPFYNVKIDGNTHRWYMDFSCPKGQEDSKNGLIAFFVHINKGLLSSDWEETTKIKYDLSIKNEDGSLKTLFRVKENPAKEWNDYGHGSGALCTSAELVKYYVNEKIIFVVDASISIEKKECFIQNEGDNLLKCETAKSKTTLVENFAGLQKLTSFSDLVIFCGDQKHLCHKAILASRSTVLKEMLENETEGKIYGEFEVTDTYPDIFKLLIDHIYTGEIAEDVKLGAEVYKQAVKYNLPDLIKACEISLLSNLTEENSLSTLITIDSCRKESPIRKDIVKFISMNVLKIMASDNWKSFSEDCPHLMPEIIHCLASKLNEEVLPTIQSEGTA